MITRSGLVIGVDCAAYDAFVLLGDKLRSADYSAGVADAANGIIPRLSASVSVQYSFGWDMAHMNAQLAYD